MAKLFGFDEKTGREVIKLLRSTRRDVDTLKRRKRHDVTCFPWYHCWAAKITARSGAINATYSAEAFNDSTVAVTAATPINRQFNTADVDYIASAVYVDGNGGPNGMAMIVADHLGGYELIVFETVLVTDCGAEGAAVLTPKIFYARSNAGGQTCTGTTWEELDFDTQGRVDNYYTHSTGTNPGKITIETTGDYKISLEMTLECTTSTTFTACECRLLKDGVEIDGSRSQANARTGGVDRDQCNLNVTVIESITGKEVISAEFRNESEAFDWTTVADCCRILVELVD